MSQRASGFARREHEHYPSPAWIVEALAEQVDLRGKTIWEPACGEGQMVRALEAVGAGRVHATDVNDYGFSGQADQIDFTSVGGQALGIDGVVTNPPFGAQGRLAVAFIKAGLRQIAAGGFMALLLPVDFDSAKTRTPLFADCSAFAGKIILTRRIIWFDRPEGERKAAPSANHAWYLWSPPTIGARQTPRIMYAPSQREAA